MHTHLRSNRVCGPCRRRRHIQQAYREGERETENGEGKGDTCNLPYDVWMTKRPKDGNFSEQPVGYSTFPVVLPPFVDLKGMQLI